jgi:ubiquinone/menaquinone biosynthesis C-methylase UbiE
MDSWENPAYEAALAYEKTAALMAAIKLDIVSMIGEDCATSDGLASKTGASRRGIRILCDFLTVMGLLSKGDGTYSVNEAGKRYLDPSSPAWMGGSIDFYAAPEILRLVLDDPASYVRNGGSPGLAHLAPDHPVWLKFAKAMSPAARLAAKRAAVHLARHDGRTAKVLDVAAGHGFYGIELAKAFPEAIVTAVDWPSVLELASANAKDAGVGERYRVAPGNAFEVNWGGEFDLVILANFLHHFSPEECATILRKVRPSLSPQGRACTVDFVPEEDRSKIPTHAMFAFLMLATTPSGDTYTLAELDAIAKKAGFRGATARPLRPTPQSLVMFET